MAPAFAKSLAAVFPVKDTIVVTIKALNNVGEGFQKFVAGNFRITVGIEALETAYNSLLPDFEPQIFEFVQIYISVTIGIVALQQIVTGLI